MAARVFYEEFTAVLSWTFNFHLYPGGNFPTMLLYIWPLKNSLKESIFFLKDWANVWPLICMSINCKCKYVTLYFQINLFFFCYVSCRLLSIVGAIEKKVYFQSLCKLLQIAGSFVCFFVSKSRWLLFTTFTCERCYVTKKCSIFLITTMTL